MSQGSFRRRLYSHQSVFHQGQRIEYDVWIADEDIARLAVKASQSKGQSSHVGPIQVRIVKQ